MTRLFSLTLLAAAWPALAADQPHILWLTSEDHGPHLGAYGDAYATTPHLDALAARGMLYRSAWSTAPVCAPARTTLISGVYPPSSGAQHMRSETRLPSYMKMYPVYLREAGYYCTNNSKEDYNLVKTGQVWDESSRAAHWKNRGADQPFFAIFNFTDSHESQIRKRPHEFVHDPAKVRVPAYHPDTPEVRQDWAQYYDQISVVDAKAGEKLKEVEEAGLAEDTIVFFYSDHGSGMPRNKRWTYNSGLQVALIVYFPPKWRHLAGPDYKPGGESSRQVGFIDLAPTVLSLAGLRPPAWMQGGAFLGKFAAPAREFNFGFRGRMDERYDMVRSLRDERYVYIRNYMPHKIYGQYLDYMFQTPTTRVWRALFDQGRLNAAQSAFWGKKPPEELYDLTEDPDEVRNIIDLPRHRERVERYRRALSEWQVRIRDVGFLPEAEIHERSADSTPYDVGHDDFRYPLERVMRTAQAASSLSDEGLSTIEAGFTDADAAARYWAALGTLMREEAGVGRFRSHLTAALDDPSPSVRTIAAEALGRYGSEAEAERALKTLLELASPADNGLYVAMRALNAIDAMGPRAASARATIAVLPQAAPNQIQKLSGYVPRLIERISER